MARNRDKTSIINNESSLSSINHMTTSDDDIPVNTFNSSIKSYNL